MIRGEEMFDVRVNSPSYSDNSSLSGCGLEDMEDLELFPDLKELVGRQVSSDSDVHISKEQNNSNNKRNIVAVRLDPGKEKELIDYLLGKSESDGEERKTNGDILQAIQQKVTQGRESGAMKPDYGSNTYDYSDDRDYPGKCMSKNAVAARENRLRKKQYIGDLEQSVKGLSSENVNLKKQVTSMKQSVTDLKTEVKYLRSVLANQSTLSALLKNIPSVPGINLTTSVVNKAQDSKGRKRQRIDDSDEENIDCNIQVDDGVYDVIEVVEEPVKQLSDNIRVIRGSGVCTRGQVAKVPKLDHSYATNNPTVLQYQKRSQLKVQELHTKSVEDEESGGGVCLHVSGSKVSLEFCSQCSRRASAEGREES